MCRLRLQQDILRQAVSFNTRKTKQNANKMESKNGKCFHTLNFFTLKCIVKKLLNLVFVIYGIIKYRLFRR